MNRTRCTNCGYAAPEGTVCPRCLGRAELSHRYAPPDGRGGPVRGFGLGLSYFAAGFTFISRHRELFKYIVIPLVICVVIFGAMVYGGFHWLSPLGTFLDSQWVSWLEWLRHLLAWLFGFLLLVLIILASFFLTLYLSAVINSPFYDLLSEKVEEIYLGRKFDEPWTMEYIRRAVIRPIVESIKLALYQGVVFAVLFIISLVSGGLGSLLFLLAGPYFGAMSIFDFIMARKGYTLAEKRRYLRANIAFSMGFGTPVYLLPFLTPFAVVGATLGFLASRNK